jgi:hypothetical protein
MKLSFLYTPKAALRQLGWIQKSSLMLSICGFDFQFCRESLKEIFAFQILSIHPQFNALHANN